MDDITPTDRSRRSVNERIDIRVGVERRRRWGREDKLRIVRESLAPNAVVTALARRYEISTGLLYTWRKQALTGLLEGFTPVRIAPDVVSADNSQNKAVAAATHSEAARGLIEVVWPNGIVVRIDGSVDERALHSMITALGAR